MCCLIGLSIVLQHSHALAKVRIVAFGDSLMAGYGLAVQDSFPAQLERALHAKGYAVDVINAGVSGDTTAGGYARLEWVLLDDPDIVIMCLGGNDSLRGLDPAMTRVHLEAILTRLIESGISVVLAGMLAPPNLGPDYTTAFNRVYPQLAQHYEISFYPFFLEGVATQDSLNQADGIHPNAAGVKYIVAAIQPLIIELLDRFHVEALP